MNVQLTNKWRNTMDKIYTITKKEEILLITIEIERVEDFMVRNSLKNCTYHEFEMETGKKLCETPLVDVYTERFGTILEVNVDLEKMADCFAENKGYEVDHFNFSARMSDRYQTYGCLLLARIASDGNIMFEMPYDVFHKFLRNPLYLKELLDANDTRVLIESYSKKHYYKKLELNVLTKK